MPLYVIEHLDPRVWEWSFLEYRHISSIVGKGRLWFTNVKQGAGRLKKLGRVFAKSISRLKQAKRACILDSSGKKTLCPADAGKFDYLVFCGVLGDWPEAGKSLQIIKKMPKAAVRNLGKVQMSTDTAVLVTKKIIDGMQIDRMKFADGIEIKLRAGESIELPYRYLLRHGKPVLPKGLVKMLKHQKTF